MPFTKVKGITTQSTNNVSNTTSGIVLEKYHTFYNLNELNLGNTRLLFFLRDVLES